MNFVMEDIFGRAFPELHVPEDRRRNPLSPLQASPALDAYTAYLHEEMRQCYLEGLDHAAIVTACAVLEYTIKSAVYFEHSQKVADRRFDQEKWDEIEKQDFSELINCGKSLGLISKKNHKTLDRFRDAVRNVYMHGATPEAVKSATVPIFEGNWQTGQGAIREIRLSSDLSLQRMYRLMHDRLQCAQIVHFVDAVVRHTLAWMNEHLAAWAKTHPTEQPTPEKINAIMDEMKRQGFDGSMAIMQQIPPELRDAAERKQHQGD